MDDLLGHVGIIFQQWNCNPQLLNLSTGAINLQLFLFPRAARPPSQ
jgi:hypothetical protein